MHRKWSLSASVFLLVGCQWFSPGPSLSASTSISLSISPIPNDDFNPLIQGRNLLIDDNIQLQFSTVTAGTLESLPLAPINFPVSENFRSRYFFEPDEPYDASGETVSFNHSIQSLTSFPVINPSETVSGSTVLAWLQSQQANDEQWNQVNRQRKLINLSATFVQDNPYYWFNHFVRTENSTLTRFDNQVVYGTGDIRILFQTGVTIQPVFAFQIHADAQQIYEIYDETYPSGFFGARDYQLRTPRAPGNFKHALTLGPIQRFLDLHRILHANPTLHPYPMQKELHTYQSTISLTRIDSQTYHVSSKVFFGEDFETATETYELKAVIVNNQWQSFTQRYQQWQPSVSS